MKRQPIIFIIFSAILLNSCSNTTAFDAAKELKVYLNTFGLNPVNGESYLFVPSNQCKNCILLDGTKISADLNKRTHIFSHLPKMHLKNFTNYHYDKEEKLMELKMVDYENKLVYYTNNTVYIVSAKIIKPFEVAMPTCEN